MAYKITDKCISCGACAGACPVGCISQGNEHYEINKEACIECGTCNYNCPANRNITQSVRTMKRKVQAARRKG